MKKQKKRNHYVLIAVATVGMMNTTEYAKHAEAPEQSGKKLSHNTRSILAHLDRL